ncbi:MAG: D-alanyl-D-alanine carboxypeptidase family protein [Chthoniobacteraceae bacterium]
MAGSTRNTILLLALSLAILLRGPDAMAKSHPAHKKPTPPPATPSPTPELAPGELPLAAAGAIVIDEISGDPLYEKNANEQFYPASTTKIMTALLIIEEGSLDKEVIVQPEDIKVEPSALDIKPGEKFTRMQMLYGLMLKSANDVAQALARDDAGSIGAFADKMNRRARELGALSTHFENPHGLHNKLHYTTPHDLALIARAAMQQPLFRKLVSTVNYDWLPEPGLPPVSLKNHNKLLTRFPGCTGLKTGYTVPAQQVLVSSALRDGREVISVVMHTDHPGIWDDSETLLTYGFSHLPPSP